MTTTSATSITTPSRVFAPVPLLIGNLPVQRGTIAGYGRNEGQYRLNNTTYIPVDRIPDTHTPALQALSVHGLSPKLVAGSVLEPSSFVDAEEAAQLVSKNGRNLTDKMQSDYRTPFFNERGVRLLHRSVLDDRRAQVLVRAAPKTEPSTTTAAKRQGASTAATAKQDAPTAVTPKRAVRRTAGTTASMSKVVPPPSTTATPTTSRTYAAGPANVTVRDLATGADAAHLPATTSASATAVADAAKSAPAAAAGAAVTDTATHAATWKRVRWGSALGAAVAVPLLGGAILTSLAHSEDETAEQRRNRSETIIKTEAGIAVGTGLISLFGLRDLKAFKRGTIPTPAWGDTAVTLRESTRHARIPAAMTVALLGAIAIEAAAARKPATSTPAGD